MSSLLQHIPKCCLCLHGSCPVAMFSRFKSALLSSVGAAESAAAAAVTDGAETAGGGSARPVKFAYGRPSFLQLDTEDELQVAGDRVIRPIIVPRDSSRLPWTAGYAESVTAGGGNGAEGGNKGHSSVTGAGLLQTGTIVSAH